ncbi:MAG: ParB/RepB/Spo0J family partition protein [Bacteroidales bacterium]|nr:ParB/RepB/Spo0J family partition protein [Bacteroidales bacterium]
MATSSKTPRGLGKGLSALLGEGQSVDDFRKPVGYINKAIVSSTGRAPETADILRIPIGMIEPNPYQPRTAFSDETLQELADSIRSLGLIQPITVRKISDGRYQIISGERRFRACKAAGFDMVPAYIREANDQGMLEMAIVENVQREDLDPIEVALSYQRLIDECSLTQDQMAGRVGKKRASVTNYLRLLKLPAKVQHDLKVGLISVGHAKVILGADDPAVQEDLCDQVISKDLSVRQLEEKLHALNKGRKEKTSQTGEEEMPEVYYRALETFGRYFGDNISLKRSAGGKGSLTVRFSSDEEMERFINAIDPRHE